MVISKSAGENGILLKRKKISMNLRVLSVKFDQVVTNTYIISILKEECFLLIIAIGAAIKSIDLSLIVNDLITDLPPDKEPLDWNTRMKIAAGAARGLEYLHDKANPPVIYRDFKSSNILLDEGFHPKLSDFGLAKLGPTGDKSHVSTRVMGTYGYCAPEYAMTGQLTVKSDVYSFGVVFLELITGRRAIDGTKPHAEQNLVTWVIHFTFLYYYMLFFHWRPVRYLGYRYTNG